MTSSPRRVAIVGGSAAGLAVATGLRDEGYDGEVLLLGSEDSLPYDRPPLSKRLFESEQEREAIALTTRGELTELGIDFRGGNPASSLDLRARSLTMKNGSEIAWDVCVIATGAAPITLPGSGLVLRSFEDALHIGRALEKASDVVIIGAGVLGCELAALARGSNAKAEVIDLQKGPMLDRLGPAVSARLESLHREQGVDFRFGSGVAQIEGSLSEGFRVTYSDETTAEPDLVLVAIGCRPTVNWLAQSGLKLDDGVVCDACCQSAPGIFAAGDVANWMNPRYGRRMRIEHRMNATEQGLAVASNILGANQAFDPIPFFWTDQYDARIQVVGVIDGTLQTDLLAENSVNGGLVVSYSRQDRIEGVLGWNMARALRSARRLIGKERRAALAEFAEREGA